MTEPTARRDAAEENNVSKASGVYVRIDIRLGAEGFHTDAPALGAAVADLRREGWHLDEFEGGEDGREGHAVLSRSWDISVPHTHSDGAYAVEAATPTP